MVDKVEGESGRVLDFVISLRGYLPKGPLHLPLYRGGDLFNCNNQIYYNFGEFALVLYSGECQLVMVENL